MLLQLILFIMENLSGGKHVGTPGALMNLTSYGLVSMPQALQMAKAHSTNSVEVCHIQFGQNPYFNPP